MILKEEIESELIGLEKTLLIPLWVRYKDTLQENPILNDLVTQKIIESIPYNIDHFDHLNSLIKRLTYLGIIIREKIFDDLIGVFLSKNQGYAIVNLGCGIDARSSRMDLLGNTWYDIDLKEVIDLKRRIFYENDNYKMIESDAFDETWFDQINEENILVISEGLFMYFSQDKVFKLLSNIRKEFSESEFMIELLGKWGEKKIHPFIKDLGLDIPYTWGIKDVNELASIGLVKISEESFLDRFPEKWGLFGKIINLFPSMKRNLSSSVYHLK